MLLLTTLVLVFPFIQSQFIEQKPQNVYDVHDNLIINNLLQSNFSSLAKLMNWKNVAACQKVHLIGDGICDDGKTY